MVLFYGSSTIWLWHSLEQDFTNNLNLGFGGAFISSLSQNFERLFNLIALKSIVLYLRGNDLSLSPTILQIATKIKSLILKIHQKFPTTDIINISIKPSVEHAKQLEKIIEINRLIKEEYEKNPFLNQIDFF